MGEASVLEGWGRVVTTFLGLLLAAHSTPWVTAGLPTEEHLFHISGSCQGYGRQPFIYEWQI